MAQVTDRQTPRGVPTLRVGGVPVAVTPSWWIASALLVVLGVRLLAGGGGVEARHVLLALAIWALLQVSVAAHEAAHALVARRRRIPVLHLALTGIGGQTALDTRRASAGDEAAIAAAGPATNLALAGLGLLLAGALEGWADGAAGAARAAAIINLVLGAVNLLPGLPSDGGAVLAAVVRRSTGSRRSGVRASAWAGLALAGLGVAVVVTLPFLGVVAPPLVTVAAVLVLAATAVPAVETLRASSRPSAGR